MHGQVLKFLLVPDVAAARRVRRLIVARGACSGVVVGTWPELLEWARRAYLVAGASSDWDEMFEAALGGVAGAFWTDSFRVSPAETSRAVESALTQLHCAADPGAAIDVRGLDKLPERPRRHLNDLLRLTQSLAGRLPDALASIRELLSAPAGDALHSIAVYCANDVPLLTRWQLELVAKLNRDAGVETTGGGSGDEFGKAPAMAPRGAGAKGGVGGAELAAILTRVLDSVSGLDDGSALGVLKSRLFTDKESKVKPDDSVQWLGVRDFLQEAEVAAGMVQILLADDPALAPADIGLLIPDSFEYVVAIDDAFKLAGCALAGLPVAHWRRDLGREAVFYFLYCRRKPAPAMALAACLSSPLMPWPREEGAVLAQTVMDGDYRLRAPESMGTAARAVLSLLAGGDSEAKTLASAVREFVEQLDGGNTFAGQVHQARVAAEQICGALESDAGIDWARLRRAVSPGFIPSGEDPDFNLEGVTLWRESQEPWRPVRCLIVLGFSQGRYPAPVGTSTVFSADDILAIRKHIGLLLSVPSEELARRRLRFKRQLRAVADSVTFLVPRRDLDGAAQSPAETLVFMHQLFSGPQSAEDRIIDLDAAGERARVRHLALADSQPPRPPRDLAADDLHFDCDLLSLRRDAQGRDKPESPSSLETLMVSRLAWLLRRLDAQPLQWAPESADVMLLGSLAHKVFEGLFRPGAELPGRDAVAEHTDALLDEAITRLAPFLRASQWQVERRNLMEGTARAARVWRDVLEQLGAEVLAGEEWLQGAWSGIAIHGQADLILGLPGDRLLVVDYKRSKSNSRRPRMEKGYDSQANLYRAMLESGGSRNNDGEILAAKIRSASRTGIVYYMLNDQVSLSDTRPVGSENISGWQALEGDLAGNAMKLIAQRIAEVRDGHVYLNREGDALFFEKQAGVKPYALEDSPLIALFSLPDDMAVAQ